MDKPEPHSPRTPRLPELREVERELSYSKVGRKARLSGSVEAMEFDGGLAPAGAPALPSGPALKPSERQVRRFYMRSKTPSPQPAAAQRA